MWRLAWRNLWRSRVRTAITGTAITLSLTLQLFSTALSEDSYVKMMDAAVTTSGGHVLVGAEGYWDSRSADKVVRSYEPIMKTIAGVEGVTAVLPRILVNGLVRSPRGNAGVQLMGLVPEAEASFDDRARFITEGTFFAGDTSDPIVLGRAVVDDLKLELGDKVIVTATDPAGEMVDSLFHLSGIIDSGSDMLDSGMAFTRLDVAQSAFGLRDAVTQLGVIIDDDDQRTVRRDAALAALGDAADGLELLTWDEAMPELVGFIEVDRRSNDVMWFVVFVVVAFGIANTFLMAVLERVRELGLLSALGLTPGRVAGLVLAESLLLAVMAIALAVLFAVGIHLAVNASGGIDLAGMSGQDMEITGVVLQDMVMKSRLAPGRMLFACSSVLVVVIISALYPAWRATRQMPATAMRTYE